MGEHMIPLAECKDGWLYKIDARNAGIGIFDSHDDSFIIVRNKFGIFLDKEIHWEADNHYGTAKPLVEIGVAPKFSTTEKRLQWLIKKEKEFYND